MKNFFVIVMTCIFLKPVYMHTLSKREDPKLESANRAVRSLSVLPVPPPNLPVNGDNTNVNEGNPENEGGNIQTNKDDQSVALKGLKVVEGSNSNTASQSGQGNSSNTIATDVKQLKPDVTNDADRDKMRTDDKSTNVVKGNQNDGNSETNKPIQKTDISKAEVSETAPDENPNEKLEASAPKTDKDILNGSPEQDKDVGKNDNKEADIGSPGAVQNKGNSAPSDKKGEEKAGSVNETKTTTMTPKPTTEYDDKESNTLVPLKEDAQKEEKGDWVSKADTAAVLQKPTSENDDEKEVGTLASTEVVEKEKNDSPSDKKSIKQNKIEEETFMLDGGSKEEEDMYDNDEAIHQVAGGMNVMQEGPALEEHSNQGPNKGLDTSNLTLNANDKKSSGSFSNDEGSHFFAYFLTFMVTAIVFYLVFHNKQRIIALIIEGRSERSRRRPGRSQYRKLDNNLEEAMIATKGSTPCTKPLKE